MRIEQSQSPFPAPPLPKFKISSQPQDRLKWFFLMQVYKVKKEITWEKRLLELKKIEVWKNESLVRNHQKVNRKYQELGEDNNRFSTEAKRVYRSVRKYQGFYT